MYSNSLLFTVLKKKSVSIGFSYTTRSFNFSDILENTLEFLVNVSIAEGTDSPLLPVKRKPTLLKSTYVLFYR